MPVMASSSINAPKADYLERSSLVWSTIGFGMLVAIGLLSTWTLRQVNSSDFWVDHTYDVIDEVQQLLSDLTDAESAARAYLLDPEDRYREEYSAAVSRVRTHNSSLRILTSDNRGQQQRLDEFTPLLMTRVDNLSEVMSARKEKGFNTAEEIRREEPRQRLANRVHILGRNLQNEEYRLLQERLAFRRTRLKEGFAATLGASIVAFIALLLAPLQVRRAIRQRNSANRDKQQSESMAHSLFEAAPQAIIISDQNGNVVMANPETERIFGYKPEDLRQQSVEILIPEALRQKHAGHRGRFFSDPQTRPMGLNLDLKARRRDGSEFNAEISLSYIDSARGTLAVAFASDVSKRRADEQAIREQREELRLLTGKLITAQDDERRRIARNLHDDLSQNLACISMDLGRLATKDRVEDVLPQIRPLQRRAAEASEQVRKISHQLHPSILDDLGLQAALDELCDEFERRSGILTHFTSRDVPDNLPTEVSSCIYYAASECLRNVSKHSRGSCVSVDISVSSRHIHLTVRDDGVGFPLDLAKPVAGIGIAAMKERVRLLGGSFAMQPDADAGIRVDVHLPFAEV